MLEDAMWMGKGESIVRAKMPWLPQDMMWYIEKAWRHPGALHQLRTQELVREAVSKVDVLKKLVVSDDVRRRFPALWTLEYDATAKKLALRMLSDLSGDCFHDPIKLDVPSEFFSKYGSVLQHGMSLLSNVVPEIVSLGIVQKVINVIAPEVSNKVERAETLYNLIDKLNLSSSRIVEPVRTSKLSPRGAVALLRDLLKLHDNSFDELRISDIAQLQCAATEDGHFVWASRQEIMALGDKLTPCDLEDVRLLKRSMSSASTETSSSSIASSLLDDDDPGRELRLSIPSISGLSAWDWRRAYCKWQLVHPSRASPLAAGSTPPHSDLSNPPSWPAIEFAVNRVASVAMLRECSLVVRVKRPSRCLGIVKCIAEGELALRDVGAMKGLKEAISDLVEMKIPLNTNSASSTRCVTVHLGSR